MKIVNFQQIHYFFDASCLLHSSYCVTYSTITQCDPSNWIRLSFEILSQGIIQGGMDEIKDFDSV